MKKTIVAVLLFMSMLLSLVPAVYAADRELAVNGGFEEYTADALPGWGMSSGAELGKTVLVAKEGAKEGEACLQFTGDSGVTISQEFLGVIPKTKYTIEVQVKGTVETLPFMKVEYSKEKNGKRSGVDGGQFLNFKEEILSGSRWATASFTVEPPKDAQIMTLMLRKLNAGDVFFDSVSVKGTLDPSTVGQEVVINPEDLPKQGTAKKKPDTPLAENEILKNGSLEELNALGSFVGWNLSGAKMGEFCQVYKEDPNGGENGVWFTGEDAMYLSQSVEGVIGGKTYHFSAYIKGDADAMSAVKVEWYGKDAEGAREFKGDKSVVVETVDARRYTKIEYDFPAPDGATSASVLVRKVKAGNVAWDDISLTGEIDTTVIEKEDETVILPPADGEKNLVQNGSFEEKDGKGAKHWAAHGDGWEGPVTLSGQGGYSGDNCAVIQTEESGNPWIRQQIPNLVEGAVYQIVSYVSSYNVGAQQVAYKIEYYNSNDTYNADTYVGSSPGTYLPNTKGEWKPMVYTFTVPEGACSIALYCRLYGTGTVCYDDVSCYMVEKPRTLELKTDWVFYYSDWNEDGVATVSSTKYDVVKGERAVEFSFLDEGNVVDAKIVPFIDGNANYTFPMAFIKEKQKAYQVQAVVRENDVTIGTYTQNVYIYDRPSYLTKDGTYIENGEVFHPVMAYHCLEDGFETMSKAGVNLVQAYTRTSYEKFAEEAMKYNIKVMWVLYPNMSPAASPQNRERTIKIINQWKDHPVTFGWMVMDEPYYNIEEPDEILEESYKLIRDLDPKHPVFICECVKDHFRDAVKYTDVLAIDPYMYGGSGDSIPYMQYAEYLVDKAVHDAMGKKPIYALLQAFDYNGMMPTGEQVAHMTYQSFSRGAKGTGYYCWEAAQGDKNLDELPLYEGLVEIKEKILDDAFLHFADAEYPLFTEQNTEAIYCRVFAKGNTLQVVAYNKTEEKQSLSVPLESLDRSIIIGSYAAKKVYGTGEDSISGSGAFSLSLEPSAIVKYELTPADAIDFSALPKAVYTDLADYAWARSAIETLREKGMVYSASDRFYEPARPITRGEFANFFMKTIGAPAQSGEAFSDVREDRFYAEAIKTGRAMGIFKGVGDNCFRPEETITRQDLMTIISRGMELSGTSDLSAFADADTIAEYAMPHVCAMIASGLIQGNADGTLNPLGNTTRAEAAVIMNRILKRQ